jgi:uncharacterized protein (DUF58 family)
VAGERQTFPLVPRRRLVGLPLGDLPSRKRGPGADVIGSRAYRPGDPVSTIDWYASARVSAATGRDEFVVRAKAADEAPRVVLVCDRRPAMAIYDPLLPWLSKPQAIIEATTAIVTSAMAAHGDIASLDLAGGEPYWLPPGGRDAPWLVSERQGPATPFDAPDDNLERALDFLAGMRSDLPPGSFVFVLSDFVVRPPVEEWFAVHAHGWDLVSVVIQDPVWEQSFPEAGAVVLPIADPATGRVVGARLSRREARARRLENEQRLADLLDELAAFGLEAVVLGTSDPQEIDRAFVHWAEARRIGRWGR